jgi:hypothetical protein
MNCKKGAVQLLHQIIQLIELIDSKDYNRPLDIYNSSTMGKHFRHIYDFFNCLVSQSESYEVDYCMRDRNENIEENKEYSIAAFEALKHQLFHLNEEDEIMVHADFEMEGGIRPIVKTSIGREIMYAYDHAVHHLAIVKIGLKSIRPDIQINENIGIAASTLRHQHAH